MKKLLLVAGALFISGLGLLNAQTKQERKIESFSKINASTTIHVIVTLGDKESLTFEAEEKIMDNLKAEVKGGELRIYCEGKTNTSKPMTAYVTAKKIEAITSGSAADVDVNSTLNTETLKLTAFGAASIKLEANATTITADASGAASITVKGKAKTFSGTASGAGHIKATDLEAEDVDVTATGAGSASVNVKGTLRATASGAGHVKYSGEPRDKKINADISSKVSKA